MMKGRLHSGESCISTCVVAERILVNIIVIVVVVELGWLGEESDVGVGRDEILVEVRRV